MLRKETAVEVFQPRQQHLRLVLVGKGGAGKAVNFGRREAEPQHIIQVEIVQLIGSDQLFGLLGNGAVGGGGQQFGADRCVQNIQQHAAQGFLPAGVGNILHNVAHQRFGYARVDAVHTHMVAVVGRPAQGKLAQIAGADDKAAVFVGVVHQLQRAHAGLAVLKGDIVAFGVLTDIGKVALHGLCNVDLAKAYAQSLAQDFGVGARAPGRAEAGHRQGDNVLGVASQHLAGAHRHQQGKAAVQPAGDAHHSALGVGMLHPLGKPLGLDAQNQLAALGAGGGVLRHKRRGGNRARQADFRVTQFKFHGGVAGGFGAEACVAHTLLLQAAYVQLGHGGAARKRAGFAQ